MKNQLKNFNKVLKKSIKRAKKNYYTKLFDRIKNDSRKTWSVINSLINKSHSRQTEREFIVDGEKISDENEIANGFNNYFLNIATKMSETLGPATVDFNTYLGEPVNNSFSFKPVNENDIGKFIDDLKCKPTLDCDGMSTELIKICKFQLIKPLTLIINQCLEKGIFLDPLKIARVSAIYKKGEKNVFDNYRPISILPALSKIFERVLHTQLCEYFNNFNLFCAHQYGFRKGHSTELAALQFIDQVMQNLENRKAQISTYMDLSKAFDCIDHDILKHKLVHYGLTDAAINMMDSYLTSRNQFVEFNGTRSESGAIEIGVPQGSILGPLLFLIYINDIVKCTDYLSTILYADDSTFSACIDNPSDPYIGDRINAELEKVQTWLKTNRLCLNTSKTKYMVFNRTHTNINPTLNIDGNVLEQVPNFNFLGLNVNQSLDWSTHLTALKQKLSRNIGILRRLRTQLPPNVLTMLYYSLIHPHLNYMILIWGYDHEEILTKQKQAMRIIHSKHFLYSHTDPLFKSSKVLKLNDIHTQAQLKFCHKYIHGELPHYFMNMKFETNNDKHDHYTRQNDELRSAKPSTEGGRKFLRHNVPKLMNNLSEPLANAMYTKSCKAMAYQYKSSKLDSYSSLSRCTDTSCYPCSVVFASDQ